MEEKSSIKLSTSAKSKTSKTNTSLLQLLLKDVSSIVLIRRIPLKVEQEEIFQELTRFGKIVNIQMITKKFYAYVEFEVNHNKKLRIQVIEDAEKCVNYYNSKNNNLILGDIYVSCYLTGTGKDRLKPLDLNPESKIILFTFYKNKVEITVKVIKNILGMFEKDILKVQFF